MAAYPEESRQQARAPPQTCGSGSWAFRTHSPESSSEPKIATPYDPPSLSSLWGPTIVPKWRGRKGIRYPAPKCPQKVWMSPESLLSPRSWMSFRKGWWPLLRVSRDGALVSGSRSHLCCLWKQVWAWRHHCPVHKCGGWGWGWVGVLDCIALRDRERVWLRLRMCKACCMPVEPLRWQACCRSMEWGQPLAELTLQCGGACTKMVGILHGAAPAV